MPTKPAGWPEPRWSKSWVASLREGSTFFAELDPDAPVIVEESVWQYPHHVLAGIISHLGSILTVANWSGHALGLVGILNLYGLASANLPLTQRREVGCPMCITAADVEFVLAV